MSKKIQYKETKENKKNYILHRLKKLAAFLLIVPLFGYVGSMFYTAKQKCFEYEIAAEDQFQATIINKKEFFFYEFYGWKEHIDRDFYIIVECENGARMMFGSDADTYIHLFEGEMVQIKKQSLVNKPKTDKKTRWLIDDEEVY